MSMHRPSFPVLALAALLVWAFPAASPAIPAWLRGGVSKPYVEDQPPREFFFFLSPDKDNPADQLAHAQALAAKGSLRSGGRQALALRVYWPDSPEAPAAQLFYARTLDKRGKLSAAFEAYQFLVENYAGLFDFNDVLEAQRRIALAVQNERHATFGIFPGYLAPEKAIPLWKTILQNAPQHSTAPDTHLAIGLAQLSALQYEEAVDSFFLTLNRFPNSAAAPAAAFNLLKASSIISKEHPYDRRSLDSALAAGALFLQRFPDSPDRDEAVSILRNLRARQADIAWDSATYYDKILSRPPAAAIAYKDFIRNFPADARVPAAQKRLAALGDPAPEANDNPDTKD